MDAKNLAVLQRLRDQLGASSEVKPGIIDPKALLSLLTDINLRLHGQPEYPKKSGERGGKHGLASKISQESPEASKPVSGKTQNGAAREAGAISRKTARAKAVARAQAAEDAFNASMAIRPCRECGKPTKADPEFFLNPVTCQRCKDRSRDIDLGIHPRKHDNFSEVTVFKGGSPGLGKRK